MNGRWRRGLLAGALVAAAFTGPAIAAAAQAPDPADVKRHIEKVLAQPEFSTKRADYEYRYRGGPWWDDGPDEEDAASGSDGLGTLSWLNLAVTIMARFTEALLWSILVAAIVLLIVYRERWMRLLPKRRATVRAAHAPTVTVGLDVRPASLPDDVAGTAWRLWRDADGRGCVSLLYRGALAMLIARFGLELPASATESDCVGRIRETTAPALAEFFRELTATWQRVAYAGQAPSEERVRALCDHWRRHFGTRP